MISNVQKEIKFCGNKNLDPTVGISCRRTNTTSGVHSTNDLDSTMASKTYLELFYIPTVPRTYNVDTTVPCPIRYRGTATVHTCTYLQELFGNPSICGRHPYVYLLLQMERMIPRTIADIIHKSPVRLSSRSPNSEGPHLYGSSGRGTTTTIVVSGFNNESSLQQNLEGRCSRKK